LFRAPLRDSIENNVFRRKNLGYVRSPPGSLFRYEKRKKGVEEEKGKTAIVKLTQKKKEKKKAQAVGFEKKVD